MLTTPKPLAQTIFDIFDDYLSYIQKQEPGFHCHLYLSPAYDSMTDMYSEVCGGYMTSLRSPIVHIDPKGIERLYPTFRKSVYYVSEYEHYENDLEIGGVYATSQKDAIETCICHEMAHAWQFYKIYELKENLERGHEKDFQRLYRILRNWKLNKRLPDQVLMRAQYDAERLEKIQSKNFLAPYKKLSYNEVVKLANEAT